MAGAFCISLPDVNGVRKTKAEAADEQPRTVGSTAPFAAHGALTANQITEVVVRPGPDGLDVVNRSQTGVIWVTIDGSDPAPLASNSFACIGVRTFAMRVRHQDDVTVKMIADSALNYTVEAIG
jgi:hypothetical protein